MNAVPLQCVNKGRDCLVNSLCRRRRQWAHGVSPAPPPLLRETSRATAPARAHGRLSRASDGSIIEWDDFDIPRGSSVRFIQPHADARSMQKVLSPYPTPIDGQLTANGQIYILNPYGVFIGGTAVLDVGSPAVSPGAWYAGMGSECAMAPLAPPSE